MNEEKIIKMLVERNECGIQAFSEIYGALVRYVIAPMLHDPREQEECLSEVIMKVWEKASTYDADRGSWKGWVTAIARNAALNRLRNSKKQAADISHEDIPHYTPSDEPGPEELLLKEERRKAFWEAVYRLSLEERTLFFRKYYYMQSTAQIAAETGLTARSVEGRLYRIKQKLRVMLGGEEYDR